jgi:hypothetical protein
MTMVEGSAEPADVPAEPRSLDPFALQPGVGSRIAGLAEGPVGTDPNYAFHTDYVEAGRGHAEVHVRFAGLQGKQGTLLLRIHLMREGGQLVLVTSERIAVNRLVQLGGAMAVRFEAFNGCRYAFFGSVLGETDAAATGLEVILDPGRDADEAGFHTVARNSDHGQDAARPNPVLVSTHLPSLEAPVSQVGTRAQLRSAEARDTLAGVPGATALDPERQWVAAYTLRCLQAYGVRNGDARGLGLCAPDDPVAGALDRAGTPATCRPRGQGGEPLVNFDYLWSFDEDLGEDTREAWLNAMQRRLLALLPGGLAVFCFRYDPLPATEREAGEAGPVPDRRDLERLALILISRGHEVAQLRLVGDFGPLLLDETDLSVAGLVVRRARLAGG